MPETPEVTEEPKVEGDAPAEVTEAPKEEEGTPADLDNMVMEDPDPMPDRTPVKVTSIVKHMVRFKDATGKEYQLAPGQTKGALGVSSGMKKLAEVKKMIEIA